ncbi:major facilitator superfamily domain-containing protein [Massariosphaeria phaeospora]|uniref:Major facilitator superfamily domain-containing protein n=1 Tax=Massariosphaeria phaeospora TaxID=100035 RepID=A0A7C8MKB9_9PLEO|nr:major facilitator superfamily domain-containing protein [Massariosphaeria phaeospora]
MASNNHRDVSTTKLVLIMIGLCLAVFLTGMDQTILATAAPTISEEFDALNDIAWWTNIYLLTLSSFQLFYGKLYSLFSIKLVYILAIVVFEIGSLICTTAPNSIALILGRAISGLGASGICSGGVLITTKIIPLSRRPAYLGIMSAVFGVAAIAGPFIGGALTDRSTWRWCFGINLPIGALTIVICILLVHLPPEARAQSLQLKDKIREFDVPGTLLMVAGLHVPMEQRACHLGARRLCSITTCFHRVAGFQPAFEVKDHPSTISKNRDIWFAASYAVTLTGGIYVVMLYLPFWFQIVRNGNALTSGVLLTPTIGAYVVGSILAGGMTSAIGYYNPGMILGTICLIPGAVLLATLKPSTSTKNIIGFELLYGFGAGFGFGQPSYVVQTLLPDSDVPIGVTFITLVQNLSASIFVAVGQSVFQNSLHEGLTDVSQGGISQESLQTGAKDLIASLPADDRLKALGIFSDSLIRTMYIPLALACATTIGALGTRWSSMKKAQPSSSEAREPNKEESEKPISDTSVTAA